MVLNRMASKTIKNRIGNKNTLVSCHRVDKFWEKSFWPKLYRALNYERFWDHIDHCATPSHIATTVVARGQCLAKLCAKPVCRHSAAAHCIARVEYITHISMGFTNEENFNNNCTVKFLLKPLSIG